MGAPRHLFLPLRGARELQEGPISRARKMKSKVSSLPLSLSQHITLLRLISARSQDKDRINKLLLLGPAFNGLVHFSESRWFDNGLEQAAKH